MYVVSKPLSMFLSSTTPSGMTWINPGRNSAIIPDRRALPITKIFNSGACQSSHSACEHTSTVEEVISILFPPSDQERSGKGYTTATLPSRKTPDYSHRLRCGREAQGYVTDDARLTRSFIPAAELTYGEYNLQFFLSLVQECLEVRAGTDSYDTLRRKASHLVFGDLGSGCGRLVIAEALAWPWQQCRGIEKVEALHEIGTDTIHAMNLMATAADLPPNHRQLLEERATCDLVLGDIYDEELSDIDVLFCYSSTFPARGDLLTELSYTLGHKLRKGAQVITTDRRLVSDGPWEFKLLRQREGSNMETGGKSVAYLWQVEISALQSTRDL